MLRSHTALVLCFVSFAAVLALASTNGTLRGRMLEHDSKRPAVGVSVHLVGTNLGALTDSAGYYVIRDIPYGSYHVRLTSVEYLTVLAENVPIRADKISWLSQLLVSRATEYDKTIHFEPAPDSADSSSEL